MVYVFAGLIALAFFTVGTLGVEGLESTIEHNGFVVQMIAKYGWMENYLKGFFVVFCMPMIFFYCIVSFLNQLMRKCGLGRKLEVCGLYVQVNT